MNKVHYYLVGGLVLLFGLGALSRILSDTKSPALIGGILNTIAGLFSKTING